MIRPCGRRLLSRWAGLLAAIFTAGCAALFLAPDVEIVGLRVTSMGVSSGTAEIELEIRNERRGDIELQGVRYRLDVRGPETEDGSDGEWMPLGEGYHTSGDVVGEGDTIRVTVDVPFEYDAVGAAVRSFLREGEVRYRLDGEVWINGALGEYQVPLRTTGVVAP